jgi:hypothetical protein
MSLNDLSGKTALVTGGGSGISLAFTLRLLEAGCNVVVADLALSPEAEALNTYTNAPKAVFQKTDVTDWAQLDAAFEVTLKTFGSIDIVCTGAGLSEPVSPHSKKVMEYQPIKLPPPARILLLGPQIQHRRRLLLLQSPRNQPPPPNPLHATRHRPRHTPANPLRRDNDLQRRRPTTRHRNPAVRRQQSRHQLLRQIHGAHGTGQRRARRRRRARKRSDTFLGFSRKLGR